MFMNVATRCLLFFFLVGFLSDSVYGQEAFRVAPYLQFGTKHSMAILWETEEPATTRVEFGKSRLGDELANLSQSKELPGMEMMHEVVLENLEPETKYFWRVISEFESGERLISEPSTFRTNVNDSTAFSFLLYGDSQTDTTAWGKVARLGWSERPNFAVLAGDLVDRGGNIDDWLVEFFPPANALMRRIPIYTALGNHEDDHPNYYRYMHNPPPEYYYTFTYGNAQFFVVDTNKPVTEGSEQYIWLEQELAKSTAPWKFVMHHHPPYSSEENDHGNSWTGSTSYGTHARNLVPLYEEYGVDFCLFGHVHMYERTWPLLKGEVNQKNGVIYINSGGAGGGLEDFAPTRSWFTAKVRSVHHYGYFMIHDNTVQFQAIDENGRLFDTLQLTKTGERWEQAQIVKPPPPVLKHDGPLFTDKTEARLTSSFEGLSLHYTLDGSTPSSQSTRYTGPIVIEDDAVLQAVTFTADGRRSRIMKQAFEKVSHQEATQVNKPQAGLTYTYYEGRWSMLPDFETLTPKREGVAKSITMEGLTDRESNVALMFDGFVKIDKDGLYTFYLESDDGSKLYINDQLLIDNDGLHGAETKQGQAALKAGYHRIKVEFMQGGGGYALKATGSGKGFPRDVLGPQSLFHEQ